MVSNITAPSGTNVPEREVNTSSRSAERTGAQAPTATAQDPQALDPQALGTAPGAGRVDVDQAREAYAREARGATAPANPLSSPAEAQETASAVRTLLVSAPDAAMQAQAGAGLAGAVDLLRTS